MRSLLILTFLCIVFIGSADARSRNPRPADFDDIARLILEESNAERQKLPNLYKDMDSKGCEWKSSLIVDWEAGTIQFNICALEEYSSKAFVNELEFSKAYFSSGYVFIPCRADRDCNWGKSVPHLSDKAKKNFFIRVKSDFVGHEILELLKPN